jgi:hypothetical protein
LAILSSIFSSHSLDITSPLLNHQLYSRSR